MSRDIKFRAWHTQTKTMHDWQNLQTEKLDTLEPTDVWKVMQYTGLKDKNGKEIYEGDIVASVNGMGAVVWDDWQARYAIEVNDIWKDWLEADDNTEHGNISRYNVIGNIYENPELLK